MAQYQTAICEGVVVSAIPNAQTEFSNARCYGPDGVAGTWVGHDITPPFHPDQIDPAIVAAMFGGGFVLFFIPFAAAWGASQMLRLLR